MVDVTIRGETKDVTLWAKRNVVTVPTILQRLKEGYRDEALIAPEKPWDTHPRTRPARPADEYEWAVFGLLSRTLPQFRFEIVVELVREIGIGEFKQSGLRKQLSRGNYAVCADYIQSYWGPGGKPHMGWMKRRADQVRRWGNHKETD